MTKISFCSRCLWQIFFVGITGILVGILFHLRKMKLSTSTYNKMFGMLPFFSSFFVSIFSLAVMTAERLFSVKYPLHHLAVMNGRNIKSLIAAVWLTVILILLIIQEVLYPVLYLRISLLLEIRVRAFLLVTFFSCWKYHFVNFKRQFILQEYHQQRDLPLQTRSALKQAYSAEKKEEYTKTVQNTA